MENQFFRKQFIDNGNKALFINITIFSAREITIVIRPNYSMQTL